MVCQKIVYLGRTAQRSPFHLRNRPESGDFLNRAPAITLTEPRAATGERPTTSGPHLRKRQAGARVWRCCRGDRLFPIGGDPLRGVVRDQGCSSMKWARRAYCAATRPPGERNASEVLTIFERMGGGDKPALKVIEETVGPWNSGSKVTPSSVCSTAPYKATAQLTLCQ